MEPDWFGVEVEEGHLRTGHRVHVPDGFVDQLGLLELDPAEVARETVAYLLERETAATVPEELSVYDLASQQGEEYTGELMARLGGEVDAELEQVEENQETG